MNEITKFLTENKILHKESDEDSLFIIYLIHLYTISSLPSDKFNIKLEFFDGFIMKKTIVNLIDDIDDFIKYTDHSVLQKLNRFIKNNDDSQDILNDIMEWCSKYNENSKNTSYQSILNNIIGPNGLYKNNIKLRSASEMEIEGESYDYFEDGFKYIYSEKLKIDYIVLIKSFIPFLDNVILILFPPQYWPIFTYNLVIKNLIKFNTSNIGNRFFDDIRDDNKYLQYDYIKTLIPLKDNLLYSKIIELRYETISYTKSQIIAKLEFYDNIKLQLELEYKDYLKTKLRIKSEELIIWVINDLLISDKLNIEKITELIKEDEIKQYNENEQKKFIFESVLRSRNYRSIKKFIPDTIIQQIKTDWGKFTNPTISGDNFIKYKLTENSIKALDILLEQKRRHQGYFTNQELNQLYLYHSLYDTSNYHQEKELKEFMRNHKNRTIDVNFYEGSEILESFSDFIIEKDGSNTIGNNVYRFFKKLFEERKEVIKQFLYEYTLEKIMIFYSNFINTKSGDNIEKKVYQYKFYCIKKNINQSLFYNKLLSFIRPYRIEHYTTMTDDKKVLILVYKVIPLDFFLNENISLIYPDNTLSIATAKNDQLHLLCQSKDSFIHQLLNNHFPRIGYNLNIKYKDNDTITKIHLKEHEYNNIMISVGSQDPIAHEENKLTIILYLAIRLYEGYTKENLHNIIKKINELWSMTGLSKPDKEDLIKTFLNLSYHIIKDDNKFKYFLHYKKEITLSLGIQYIEIQKSFKINDEKSIYLTSTVLWDYYVKMTKLNKLVNYKTESSLFENLKLTEDITKEQISPIYEIYQYITEQELTVANMNKEIDNKMSIDDKDEKTFKYTRLTDTMLPKYDTNEYFEENRDFSLSNFKNIVAYLKETINKITEPVYICSNTVGLRLNTSKLVQNHEHFIKIQSNLLQHLSSYIEDNESLRDKVDISFHVQIYKGADLTYQFFNIENKDYIPISKLYEKHDDTPLTKYNDKLYANIVYHNRLSDKQYSLVKKFDNIKTRTDIAPRFSSLYSNHYEHFFDVLNFHKFNRKNLILTNPFENMLLLSGRCKNISKITNINPYNIVFQPTPRDVNTTPDQPPPKVSGKEALSCENILYNLNLIDTGFIEYENHIYKTKVIGDIVNTFNVAFDTKTKYKQFHQIYDFYEYFFNKSDNGGNNPNGKYPPLRIFLSNLYLDHDKKSVYFSPLTYMMSSYIDKIYVKHICDKISISIKIQDKSSDKNASERLVIDYSLSDKIDRDTRNIVFQLPNKGNDPFLTDFPYYGIEENIVNELLDMEKNFLETGIIKDNIMDNINNILESINARTTSNIPQSYHEIGVTLDQIRIATEALYKAQKLTLPPRERTRIELQQKKTEYLLDLKITYESLKEEVEDNIKKINDDLKDKPNEKPLMDKLTGEYTNFMIEVNKKSKDIEFMIISIKDFPGLEKNEIEEQLKSFKEYKVNPYNKKYPEPSKPTPSNVVTKPQSKDIIKYTDKLKDLNGAIKYDNNLLKKKSNDIDKHKANIKALYNNLLIQEDDIQISYNRELITYYTRYIPLEDVDTMIKELDVHLNKLTKNLGAIFWHKINYMYYKYPSKIKLLPKLLLYYVSLKKNYEILQRSIRLRTLLSGNVNSTNINYLFDDIDWKEVVLTEKQVAKERLEQKKKKREREEGEIQPKKKKKKKVTKEITPSIIEPIKEGQIEARSIIRIYIPSSKGIRREVITKNKPIEEMEVSEEEPVVPEKRKEMEVVEEEEDIIIKPMDRVSIVKFLPILK